MKGTEENARMLHDLLNARHNDSRVRKSEYLATIPLLAMDTRNLVL